VSSSSTQHSLWTSSSSSNSPQPLFTSPVKIPSSGILVLTEEERRTLVAEGYPIPTKLPLTKQEEKNLKKIRRKIKNKISAQESRRKKKEYLEHLEKRVEFVSMENITLRKKLDALESNNKSLASQLQKLQSLASRVTAEMQAATCIAVN
jgi:cyclic AMP-responsive element-binding protein 3